MMHHHTVSVWTSLLEYSHKLIIENVKQATCLFNICYYQLCVNMPVERSRLELSGAQQVLVYADFVNCMCEIIHTIQKYREALVLARSRLVQKQMMRVPSICSSVYLLFFCILNCVHLINRMYVKNHNIMVANKSFENWQRLITVFGNDTTKPNVIN